MSLETGTVYVTEQNIPAVIPKGISIFGFTVSFFGICLVFAALAGLFVVTKEARRRKMDTEWFLAVVAVVLIFSVLGARCFYAVFCWSQFSEQPLQVLYLRKGGFAYFGALLAGIAALKLYCRKKETDFFQTADVVSLGAAAAAIPVWIGCIFSGEPIGRYSDGAFSMRFSTEYLSREKSTDGLTVLEEHLALVHDELCVSCHPVALYGLLGAVLVLLGTMVSKRFVKRTGALFWDYVLLTSCSILVTDMFRADRFLIWGTKLSVNSVVSIVFMVAAITRPIIMRIKETKKI